MSLFLINGVKLYAGEAVSRPSAAFGLAIVSFALAFIYAVLHDFAQTFLKKPKHFVKEKALDLIRRPKVQVPLVEPLDGGDYRELLARGSRMYPNTPYKIPHFPGEIVILPNKYLEEIKSSPESKLSFQQGSYDMLVGKHTGITGHDLAMANLIRRDVGRLLDRVYTVVDDEALKAITKQIGSCEDWTTVVLMPEIVRVIIKISQRVFVGEELCRDERWLRTIADCTAGAFGSVTTLWQYNWIMRPLVAWRLPGLRAIRKHRADARKLIEPVIQRRLKAMEAPNFQPPPDLIQLVIDGTKDGKGRSVDYQLNAQIGTGRAALFTTGMTVFHLLYDLTIHPEYIEPIRQEVLALGDVPFNRVNVAKLVKMDSFIRECQRWSKFMLIGTIRKVVKPVRFADGLEFPVGTLLAVDTQHAVFNKSTLPNPEEFDGFRFERLRALPGNESKFQAVTTGPDHLVFGYGPQACPGRYFAIHEAKVVLARTLATYEFKLKNKPGKNPLSGAVGVLTQADPSVEFLFKRRT